MNGRQKRRKRAERARNMEPIARGVPWRAINGGLCLNGCGERGPHFVPPSMGERGFYICKPLSPFERPPGNIYVVPDDGGPPLSDTSERPSLIAPAELTEEDAP